MLLIVLDDVHHWLQSMFSSVPPFTTASTTPWTDGQRLTSRRTSSPGSTRTSTDTRYGYLRQRDQNLLKCLAIFWLCTALVFRTVSSRQSSCSWLCWLNWLQADQMCSNELTLLSSGWMDSGLLQVQRRRQRARNFDDPRRWLLGKRWDLKLFPVQVPVRRPFRGRHHYQILA